MSSLKPSYRSSTPTISPTSIPLNVHDNLLFLDHVITAHLFGSLAIHSHSTVYVTISPATPQSTRPVTTLITLNEVKPELDRIIREACQSHQAHSVKDEDVKSFQKARFGRFYKESIPYGTTATDLDPAMFGMMLDMEPKADDGSKLDEIVTDDIGKPSGYNTVVMVARSGAGKTTAALNLVKKHFVVYAVCSNGSTMKPSLNDPNFDIFAKDLQTMANTLPTATSEQDFRRNYSKLKELISNRVDLEFLARLLFLLFLLQKDSQFAPEMFLREQLTGGIATIRKLVEKLRVYMPVSITAMLGEVEDTLMELIGDKRALVIVLDEANVAAKDSLGDRLFSATAALNNTEVLDPKNNLLPKYRRGFLSPLCAALKMRRATLIVLGTAFSLANADQVHTAIGKDEPFVTITKFPLFNVDNVMTMLKRSLKVSDDDLPPSKVARIVGRPRFAARTFKYIKDDDRSSKEVVLTAAIEETITHSRKDLVSKISSILEADMMGGATHLLSRMVIGYEIHNKVTFARQEDVDLVDNALCSLRQSDDGYNWIMDEPLVIEAVKEELKNSSVDPNYFEYLDQLNRIIANLGAASAAKGEVFEPLVRRSLQRFNGISLPELPFLKNLTLPEWCKNFKLQVDEINTAKGFGCYDGVQGDLEFFKIHPLNKMLVEKPGTRQDGAWFFSEEYAGSLAIKLYTSPLASNTNNENEASSDIRCSFLQSSGVKANSSLRRIREEFEKSGIPQKLKGILRIHLVFPKVQDGTPKSHVAGNDVLVYIDCSNMDEFFDETTGDWKEEIRDLKKVISYVADESKKSDREPTCSCKVGKCNTARCSCRKLQKKCALCKCSTQCQNRDLAIPYV